MSGNYSKIRKVFPDIGKYPEAEDLERLASKLDRAEHIESFIKSDNGQMFREHFRVEIANTIKEMFDNVHKTDILVPTVQRLQVLTKFYQTFVRAEDDAETLRNMVDDYIEEIKL